MNPRALLVAVRDLVRPAFVFLVVSIALMGSAQAGAAADQRVTFLVAVAILGWAVFAATLNDVADRALDRSNLGHTALRPVADDRLSPVVITTIAATSAAASLAASALLSPASLLAALAGLLCAGAYSFPAGRLTGRGLVTSLFLPMVYVVTPYATGRWCAGLAFRADDLLLVAGLYVSFVGRLLLKDFRDEHGDRLFGKRTFLVRYGRRTTCLLSGCAWMAGAGILLVARHSWPLVGAWIPLCLAVVVQLRQVSDDEWGIDDVYRITMIAIAGRATLVSLLADIGLHNVGAPAWAWWLTQATVVSFSLEAVRRWSMACRSNPARLAPWPVAPPFPTPSGDEHALVLE